MFKKMHEIDHMYHKQLEKWSNQNNAKRSYWGTSLDRMLSDHTASNDILNKSGVQ